MVRFYSACKRRLENYQLVTLNLPGSNRVSHGKYCPWDKVKIERSLVAEPGILEINNVNLIKGQSAQTEKSEPSDSRHRSDCWGLH